MVLTKALAAQSVSNLSQHYLLAADASDSRAIWVNPSGLARRAEASFGLFAGGEERGGDVRVSQYGIQLASRAFGFGWQHDDFAAGGRSNVYVVSLGLGDPRFGLGGSRRWYRPGFRPGSSWDLGGHLAVLPNVDVAAVWRDIGSPAVGDSVLEEAIVVGAGASLLGRIRFSGEWQAATSGFVTRRARATVAVVAGRGVAMSATADFSSDPNLRAFAVALHVARPRSRFTGHVRDSETAAGPFTFGLSALSVTAAPARRFSGR